MGSDDSKTSVAVVGAGAAGLAAALFAAREGVRVVLLEGKPRPGAKILISGGGRCNVLPSSAALSDFDTSGSARVLRNILASWPLERVREFFEHDLGVELVCEETGKLFPASNRARDVLDALLEACSRAGVDLRCGYRMASLEPEGDGFVLGAGDGRSLRARRVVLATGGLSVPKTGSDGAGLAMLSAMGHTIEPTRPALVPLVAAAGPWRDLAGVSAPARIHAMVAAREVDCHEGGFLFTHRGFSGPVVLDASAWVTSAREGERARLVVQWLGPSDSWDDELRQSERGSVVGVLRRYLPRRLAELVLVLAGIDASRRVAELDRSSRRALVRCLDAWPLPVEGHEGYAKAEVTAGGVALSEVVTKTLESRCTPGLYLCGELLDVTGRIGGFNFLWAWVSGRLAGAAAARSLRA